MLVAAAGLERTQEQYERFFARADVELRQVIAVKAARP